MILLVGFAANATAIKIVEVIPEAAVEGATAATEAVAAIAGGHAARALVAASSLLAKRAGGGTVEAVAPDLEANIVGEYYFGEGWHKPVFWAVTFFLIAKLARFLGLALYGAALPRFRKSLWLQALFIGGAAGVFLPIMFIHSPRIIVLLCFIGIIVDYLNRYFVAAASQYLHGRTKHRGNHQYFPAVSVEHLMERCTLFSILIIGESILNSTYTATAGSYGFSQQYGRAALAVVIAFSFMWLTFDADGSRTFCHALRRHWWRAITFTNLYYPLCASLILMSSALYKLIQAEAVESGFQWYFGGSLSVAVLCIAAIACLHESLDLHGSALASTKTRIVMRIFVAILFAVIPIKDDWTSLQFLALYAGVLVLLVAFETIGKLGAVARVYDEDRAAELERWRQGQQSDSADASRMPSGVGSLAGSELELGCVGDANVPGGNHRRGASLGNALEAGKRRLAGKERDCPRATSKDAWHTYEDLSYDEKGEEDVGNEAELGVVEARPLIASRRWALVSL